MALKVKPLGDRVIVEMIEEKEQHSDGGIIIPDSAKEKPSEAKVVALGTGKTDEQGNKVPFEVKKGDKVPVSYTHLRAHETREDLVCRLLLEKKKKN